jgi:hypothetical protein
LSLRHPAPWQLAQPLQAAGAIKLGEDESLAFGASVKESPPNTALRNDNFVSFRIVELLN